MNKFFSYIILVLVLIFSLTGFAQKTEKQTLIVISTSYGDIKLKLYNETPKHRDNFIKLVKDGTLNETLFHRIIKDFMIQGGDPDSKNAAKGVALGEGGLGYTVPAEFNSTLIHKKGVLAAARESDDVNPEKASSSCQFYIVQGRKFTRAEIEKMLKGKNARREVKIEYTEEQLKTYETIGGTPHLDMDYTIFGEVVEGLEVLDKIAEVKKDKRDRPEEDIKMTIKIVKK
jgi:peptidyl-prolyl cis-trans isomerase B (cyclophilin B)